MTLSRRPSRSVELVRGAWGATLLLAPDEVLKDVLHLHSDRSSTVVTRVLGARQLTQAVLSGVRPSPEVLAMGVWVDAAHAMTAAGLATTDRYRTRAGVIDGVVATLWAIAGYRALTGATPTAPAHDRRRDQLARAVLGFVPGGPALLDHTPGPTNA